MRFGLTVVAQHVARAKQPGDAESKRLASARGKEGHAGAAQRAGGDRARHDFQCAIGAFVPVEDRNRMGPGAVAVTQTDDRIAILQRTGPLRGYETCRIDRQDARAWQTTRQDLVGPGPALRRCRSCLRDGECGTREGQQGQRGEQALERGAISRPGRRHGPTVSQHLSDRRGGSILAVGQWIGGNWNRGGAVVLAQGEANRRGDTCSSLEQVSPFYADPAMPGCGRKAASAGSCHRAVGRGEWRRLRGSPRQWPASMPERRGCR